MKNAHLYHKITSLDQLKEYLEIRIKEYKDILEKKEKESFYDLGLDSTGMPISFGNADDVYSDGYYAGEQGGQLEMFEFLLDKIT